MKRQEYEELVVAATACFSEHGWTLPPNPKWDVTDFGLGNWCKHGLVLVNLAEEPEYCEKLMYAQRGMTTPAHCHQKKKEDIIVRWGTLQVRVWAGHPFRSPSGSFPLRRNGVAEFVSNGDPLLLTAGERVTLVPGVYHEFAPDSKECIIGEVSTANDDLHDNFFADPNVGRFPMVEED